MKGLHAKAKRGEIANFTGVSSPYEPPGQADLILDGNGPIGGATQQVLATSLNASTLSSTRTAPRRPLFGRLGRLHSPRQRDRPGLVLQSVAQPRTGAGRDRPGCDRRAPICRVGRGLWRGKDDLRPHHRPGRLMHSRGVDQAPRLFRKRLAR